MISFSGAGSSDPDGTIVGYAWNFGDGATATGATASHGYAAAGTYTVTLTVTDNKGATDGDTAIMTIADRAPLANAGGNVAGTAGVAVGFDGSASSDPDGSITSWAWTFGDGASGTGATPSHVYTAAGTYTATLTVTDNNGARSSDTTVATIATAAGGPWAQSIGSIDSDGGYAVASDAAGDMFIGGTFRDSTTVGTVTLTSAGGADWFIAKYSPAGTLLWAHNMGGAGDDYLEGIAVDGAGDVVATGRFSGTASLGGPALVANGTMDIGLAKYAGATGAHVWSKGFGGAYDDTGAAVAIDSGNNLYLTGYFRGIADFGTGPLRVPYDTDLDVFVAKFTPAGAPVWARNFTNSGNDRGYGIAVDGQGVVVVGSFSNGIDFGGGELFSQNAMVDAFVVRLSASNGAYQWARQLGAPDGNEAAYATAITPNGLVVVVGYAVQSVDFGGGLLAALGGSDGWVAAYSATSGAHVWSRRVGGMANDYAYGVAVSPDGTIVVTGAFEGTANFGGTSIVPTGGSGSDVFVAKYTASGSHVWSRGMGGTGTDVAEDVAVSPAGNPIVAGYFYGTANFGGASVTSAGMADAFVTKLAP